jgi:hypothetical protein
MNSLRSVRPTGKKPQTFPYWLQSKIRAAFLSSPYSKFNVNFKIDHEKDNLPLFLSKGIFFIHSICVLPALRPGWLTNCSPTLQFP